MPRAKKNKLYRKFVLPHDNFPTFDNNHFYIPKKGEIAHKKNMTKQTEIFIKVPLNLIRPPTGFDNERYAAAKLFTYVFLKMNTPPSRRLFLTLYDLQRLSGVKSPRSTSTRVRNLTNALQEFVDSGELYVGCDSIHNFKLKDNIIADCFLDDGIGRWVALTFSEYQSLFENNSSTNRMRDLLVYLYIKSCIWKRRDDESPRSESGVLSQKQISEDVLINRESLSAIIRHLQDDLELIRFCKVKNQYRDEHKYFNAKTVYVLNKPGCEDELASGVREYVRRLSEYQEEKEKRD